MTYAHIPRWRKLFRIGQGHLAPGMSLVKLQQLFARYKIGDNWLTVPDATVDALFEEIAGIALACRERNKTIKPTGEHHAKTNP